MRPQAAADLVWGLWALSWGVASIWADPAQRRSRAWAHWIVSIVGIGLIFSGQMANGRFATPRLWTAPPAVAWAMVALSVLGFAFCWWARLHLGRLWSSSVTRKADHHIVDTGPYRLVRHPIYTGLLTAALAQSVIAGTSAALIGLPLAVLGFWMKARTEEAFLKTELGAEAYDAYARRTPMLIPFIGRPTPSD